MIIRMRRMRRSSSHMTRRAVLEGTASMPLRCQPLLSKQESSLSPSMLGNQQEEYPLSPGTRGRGRGRAGEERSGGPCVGASKSSRFAEVAGGTAAECTAVCCCCPCATIDLLVLAIVKVPAGLCRRALHRRRAGKRRRKLLQPKVEEEEEMCVRRCTTAGAWPDKSPSRVVSEREQEMWETFGKAGFWRSPSQKDQPYPTLDDCLDLDWDAEEEEEEGMNIDEIHSTMLLSHSAF